ncbi:MAG: ABC transporter ATP-binding protein [Nitrospinota bacterium]
MSSTNGSPLLKVSRLEAGYGDIQVLWGIDIEVYHGEIVAIVGSNGAGKTTFLRTLSGLLKPTAGSIAFDGQSIERESSEKIVGGGISHVPEGRRLFPAMTLEDNLLMGAYARKLSVAELQPDMDRVFKYFPILHERRRQLAGSLSGGEQQMCAVARGLMARPKLLLIDELSLGLAPRIVEELSGIVQEINAEGVTVVLVEQDVLTALEVSSRAYVFETGRVSLAGPSQELMAKQEVKRAYLGM